MKLNLGCGTKIIEDWINVDLVRYPGVDFICDITELPLPFENNSCERVRMSHIIEHLPCWVDLIEDLYRVCKDGAVIEITVPHIAARNAWTDPTHCNFFIERTFHYFEDTESIEHSPFHGRDWNFKLKECRITFGTWWWLKPVEWFANKFTGFYENHMMFIFQPCDVHAKLEVVKDGV